MEMETKKSSVIFHVEFHPVFTWFAQCVTFGFFPSAAHELAYNLFNMFAMYLVPLVIILLTYSLILCKITQKSRENRQQLQRNGSVPTAPNNLRRSGIGRIEKARIRTLKMTIVIVLVFVTCWTPYFVICAWWWIDAKSAATVNPKTQRALFIFAVSNSCVNPIVYGTYAHTITREIKKCLRCFGRDQAERPVVGDTGARPPSSLMVPPKAGSSQNDYSSEIRENLDVTMSNKGDSDVTTGAAGGMSGHSRQLESYVFIANTTADRKGPEMITRKLTPPHVASGRGNRERFEKYLLI